MPRLHAAFAPALALALALAAVCARADPAPPRGSSVLFVTDAEDVQATHTRLLSHLTDTLGRKVTHAHASASKPIALRADGAYVYDAIILLLTGRAALDRALPIPALTAFVDDGRALLVATAGAARSSYADRAAELLGVDTDERGHVLVDHHRALAHAPSPGWVGVGGLCASDSVFGPALARRAAAAGGEGEKEEDGGVVAFRGAGASLFRDNELVAPLMWGSAGAFGRRASADGASAQPLRKVPRVAGAGAVLAAGLTTWDGGRAAWLGSADALSDEGHRVGGAAHGAAMQRLVGWALGERGVLRVARVSHGLVADGGAAGEDGGPAEYRVKDVVEFAIEVHEWDGAQGKWTGFRADDMQVEFVMLNPWVRTRLHAAGNGSEGVYTARIQVPDQIGVYKFKVEYVRAGVSPLRVERVVPVRPFLHNEYERFIPMAAPYYLASFSMMGGVFVLAAILLFGNADDGWETEATKEE